MQMYFFVRKEIHENQKNKQKIIIQRAHNGMHDHVLTIQLLCFRLSSVAETDTNRSSVVLLDSYVALYFNRGAMVCDVLCSEGGRRRERKRRLA